MDAELNMNKIRRFGELQEEIFNSTEDWVPLITLASDDGFAIHNPFMDVSRRFLISGSSLFRASIQEEVSSRRLLSEMS